MLVARQPLEPLSTSSIQMSERRLSSRLHQKDVDPTTSNRVQVNGNVKTSKQTSDSVRVQAAKSLNEKKRKLSEWRPCDARSGPVLTSFLTRL